MKKSEKKNLPQYSLQFPLALRFSLTWRTFKALLYGKWPYGTQFEAHKMPAHISVRQLKVPNLRGRVIDEKIERFLLQVKTALNCVVSK